VRNDTTHAGMLTADEIQKAHPVGKPVYIEHDQKKRIGTVTRVEIINENLVKVYWKKD
jgi:hypothetical protein